MQHKIIPNLWFDDQAEEAANFYASVFKNAKVGEVTRYGDSGSEVAGRPKGSVMTASFEIEGTKFVGINGGPAFQFSPAISFLVNCDTQEEIDELWEKLSADPEAEQCGWLKDKFGVSWQIVPSILDKLVTDPDPAKAERAMKAMLSMKKLSIAELQAAADGS